MKLPKLFVNHDDLALEEERKLIHMEAEIGGQVFGPLEAGRRREFFCLDEHTWIWHEEWTDSAGQKHIVTTRYDVRPNGVLKSQGGNTYQRISKQEARNLYHASKLYEQQVGAAYGRLLQTA